MEKPFIPVDSPMLIGNEKAYVMDYPESTWISSAGDYIPKFEEELMLGGVGSCPSRGFLAFAWYKPEDDGVVAPIDVLSYSVYNKHYRA